MSNDDPMDLTPSDLDAYRERKRKEKFVLSAVERAVNLRDLLTSALAGFHTGSATDRRIIGFALNDVLLHISPKEIDNLRGLLKKLETTRRFD
jgi:hypothetical protein